MRRRACAPERVPASERARANLKASVRLLDSYAGVGDLATAARLIQMAIDGLREAEEKEAAGAACNAPRRPCLPSQLRYITGST